LRFYIIRKGQRRRSLLHPLNPVLHNAGLSRAYSRGTGRGLFGQFCCQQAWANRQEKSYHRRFHGGYKTHRQSAWQALPLHAFGKIPPIESP